MRITPNTCPHNEIAFSGDREWCETCGTMISGPGKGTVQVHPSDLTLCSAPSGEVCGHGERTVTRDARDWSYAEIR